MHGATKAAAQRGITQLETIIERKAQRMEQRREWTLKTRKLNQLETLMNANRAQYQKSMFAERLSQLNNLARQAYQAEDPSNLLREME